MAKMMSMFLQHDGGAAHFESSDDRASKLNKDKLDRQKYFCFLDTKVSEPYSFVFVGMVEKRGKHKRRIHYLDYQ